MVSPLSRINVGVVIDPTPTTPTDIIRSNIAASREDRRRLDLPANR